VGRAISRQPPSKAALPAFSEERAGTLRPLCTAARRHRITFKPVHLTHFNVPYEAGDTNRSSDGNKIAFEWDVNGMKQSDPAAYAEVWTMNADGNPL
jgi:hypothetical protein